MNKSILYGAISASIIAAFFVGMETSSMMLNKNPFGTIFDKIDKNTLDDLPEVDTKSLIRIESQTDLSNTKSRLINYIWRDKGFPTWLPSVQSVNDARFNDLENLDHIEALAVIMEHNVSSNAYLFISKNHGDKLVVYQQGHDGGFINGKPLIQRFLSEGYSVLAFSMPLLGDNNQPWITDTDLGPIKLESHDHLRFLDSQNFSSIKYFVEPIAVSLNYLDQQYDFTKYYFVGLSGGGWTGVIYSAIDNRISQTYSVSGSLPTHLRLENEIGDYEQTLPEFYRIANYLELYIMSSYGEDRKLVQMFNKYDPCCFSGTRHLLYENNIKDSLAKLGSGNFYTYLDETHKEHKISDAALQVILDHMKE